jgi:hypothetical protein
LSYVIELKIQQCMLLLKIVEMMWHPILWHLFVDLSVGFSFISFIVEIDKITLIASFYKLIKSLTIKIYEVSLNIRIFLASNALHGKIKQEAIVIDPIGAILISIYIIIAWILQANSMYCLYSYVYSYSTELFSN